MAETVYKKISQDITEKIKKFSADYNGRSTGRVIFSGDGVIRADGLSDVQYGEMLDIDGKSRAIVLDLHEKEIGAIVLDEADSVYADMLVKSTGHVVEVPVGVELFGRVVDSLGNPIDGLGPIGAKAFRPIEAPAPSIRERAKITEPLHTGILAVDAMVPIGKGQR